MTGLSFQASTEDRSASAVFATRFDEVFDGIGVFFSLFPDMSPPERRGAFGRA